MRLFPKFGIINWVRERVGRAILPKPAAQVAPATSADSGGATSKKAPEGLETKIVITPRILRRSQAKVVGVGGLEWRAIRFWKYRGDPFVSLEGHLDVTLEEAEMIVKTTTLKMLWRTKALSEAQAKRVAELEKTIARLEKENTELLQTRKSLVTTLKAVQILANEHRRVETTRGVLSRAMSTFADNTDPHEVNQMIRFLKCAGTPKIQKQLRRKK